jgi:hypothetical protein
LLVALPSNGSRKLPALRGTSCHVCLMPHGLPSSENSRTGHLSTVPRDVPGRNRSDGAYKDTQTKGTAVVPYRNPSGHDENCIAGSPATGPLYVYSVYSRRVQVRHLSWGQRQRVLHRRPWASTCWGYAHRGGGGAISVFLDCARLGILNCDVLKGYRFSFRLLGALSRICCKRARVSVLLRRRIDANADNCARRGREVPCSHL